MEPAYKKRGYEVKDHEKNANLISIRLGIVVKGGGAEFPAMRLGHRIPIGG